MECFVKFCAAYTNLAIFLLITTVSIFAYKIASPSNKFADDQKIERFLNQTADMSSAHFDIEFDQLCESGSDFCVPAFRQLNEAFVRKIVTAPEYKLAACILPKCVSTKTTHVFAYLYDDEAFEKFNWSNTVGLSSAHHKNDYDSFRTFKHNLQLNTRGLNEWKLFVSVRDPIQRFVSAFVDKCLNERNKNLHSALYGHNELCALCGENFSCFLREQYKLISNYASGRSKFSNYLLQHVAPQTWFCDFENNIKNYTLFKYESNSEGKRRFHDFIKSILKERTVPNEKITYVLDRIIGYSAPKSTKPKPLELTARRGTVKFSKQMAAILIDKLLRDETNLKIFLSIFYYDYKYLNYPIPQLLK